MGLSNLEIRQIVREIKALEGSRFQKMQRTPKGYKIKLQSAEIMMNPPEAVYITRYPVKGETDGLSAYAKKWLAGSRLESATQHGMDRVITLTFDSGWNIIIELFSTGNIIILDDDGLTRHALRYQSWKDREIKPKRQYKYPSSRGLDPVDMELEDFTKVFTQDAIRSMVKGIKMSGKYLEVACKEAGVDKEKEPTDKEIGKLFNAVKSLVDRSEPGSEGEPVLFPTGEGFEARESLSDALDEYYAKPEPERKKESKFSHRLGEQEKAVDRLADDGERYREYGDWLQAHSQEVEFLIKKVKDLRKEGLKDKDISKELGTKVRVAGKKAYLTLKTEKKADKASADAN